jgi:cytochrome c biogenesis protein CcdA
VDAPLWLALSAGMLGAVNPCGFALLPAYLSVLVATSSPPSGPHATAVAVARALRCTAALTTGYVVVFGAFGLLLTPLTGWLEPRLPWLTVLLGALLLAAGGWLLAGRSLSVPPAGRLRAPAMSGSVPSMVLFGMAYAVASLGCAVGPFLAIVVSSLRAGSILAGLSLFLGYAGGMGLVIGVTAVAVALFRAGVVARLRRAAAFVSPIGGIILVLTGAYVAYYGVYELRLVKNVRVSGHDPVVNVASEVQRRLSDLVSRVSVGWWAGLLLVLVLIGPVMRFGVTRLRAPRPGAMSRRPRSVGADGR